MLQLDLVIYHIITIGLPVETLSVLHFFQLLAATLNI